MLVCVCVCLCVCEKPHLNEKHSLHRKVTKLTFLFAESTAGSKQKHHGMPVPSLSDTKGNGSVFALSCFPSLGFKNPFP